MWFLFLRRLLDRSNRPDDLSLIGELTLGRSKSRPRPAKSRPDGQSATSAFAPQRGLRSDVDKIKPAPWRVAWRLLLLVLATAYWYVAMLVDWLFRGWPSTFAGEVGARRELLIQRRAVRLRRLLQRLGGTFIKVGQQMAIRADVLTPAYCRELEHLLDNATPLDPAFARETIEEETGRPLDAVFEDFDFDAIGRASIACVYQARLFGGDRVAVKIRRPRIVHTFKADLAALGALLRLFEFLTILRPGVTQTFQDELRKLLLEELDMRIESRYQELFRRYIKGWKKLRVTAPAIYPDLCTERLMVSELIDDAISAKRILAILASGDEDGLRELEAKNIDPVKVAKQLIRASQFQFFDCPFFHGDPHPANILVRDDNRLVFIDFGACGVFAEMQRAYLRRMNYFQAREDVGGMVQCVIHLMEPLPPMELSNFRRDLEAAWWHGFYGIQSRYSEWWERTSFRLWTALLSTVREYHIPLPLSVLRMIRATLLYDTVGARLYPQLDVFEEFRHYQRFAARRTKKDAETWLAQQLVCGIDPMVFVRLKQAADVADGLLFDAQRVLRGTRPAFIALVGKGFSVVLLFLRWTIFAATVTLLALGSLALVEGDQLLHGLASLRGQASASSVTFADMSLPDYFGVFRILMQSQLAEKGMQAGEWILLIWGVVIFLVTLKYLRHAWFRMSDPDSFL